MGVTARQSGKMGMATLFSIVAVALMGGVLAEVHMPLKDSVYYEEHWKNRQPDPRMFKQMKAASEAEPYARIPIKDLHFSEQNERASLEFGKSRLQEMKLLEEKMSEQHLILKKHSSAYSHQK